MSWPEGWEGPTCSLMAAARAHAVAKAVETLRSQAGDAVALAVLNAHGAGATYTQLAEALGVAKSRVTQLVARGRELRTQEVPEWSTDRPSARSREQTSPAPASESPEPATD